MHLYLLSSMDTKMFRLKIQNRKQKCADQFTRNLLSTFKARVILIEENKRHRCSPYLLMSGRAPFCSKVLVISELECASSDKGVAIVINDLYLNMSIHCTRERFPVNSLKVN